MENAIGRANENLYLSGKEERYAIYQLGDSEKGRDYRFMGMDFVTAHNLKTKCRRLPSGLMEESCQKEKL